MPGPPQFGGAPITNIRNTKSAQWRAWLKPENRCVVPFNSFCEYADSKSRKTPALFALNDDRPLAFFAGIWRSWRGLRGINRVFANCGSGRRRFGADCVVPED